MIESERLRLRQFQLEDADFVLQIVNTQAWLDNIGDKQVHNLDDARNYIEQGPLRSYREHGYGGWLVELKSDNTPIGICGFYQRDYLDGADLGYAFLPDYWGRGYALEAAQACLDYASQRLLMSKLYAICTPTNRASIKLLKKLEFKYLEDRQEAKDTVAIYARELG